MGEWSLKSLHHKKAVGTTKYTKHTKEKASVSNQILTDPPTLCFGAVNPTVAPWLRAKAEWVNDFLSTIGSIFVWFVYFVV